MLDNGIDKVKEYVLELTEKDVTNSKYPSIHP
jgi:hypothetical protein